MTTPINQTDVLTAVTAFVDAQKRPCPQHVLTAQFGDDVLDVIDALKEQGVLLGLRGRNGGYAVSGSEIVAKRAEHAAKKAAKVAAKAPAAGNTEAA